MPEESPQPPRALKRPLAIAAVGLLAIVAITWIGRANPRGEWRRTGSPIEVASWAPYWQPDSALASFTPNGDLFGDLSVVAYSATSADSITTYPGLPDDMIATYREATERAGVPLVATVFDDSPSGTMAAVLADPATRARHVQVLLTLVTTGGSDGKGFDGVDLDYETFAFGDSRDTWSTTSPNWIQFLTELSAGLRPLGKQLIVSVPPVYDGKRSDESGYWVYDYAAMGPLVDRIRVMTYDYSIASGNPGPIAPLAWVQRVVDAVTELVPASKIDLGIPTYGYDWVVTTQGACPADQMPVSKAMSTARAARTVAERGITPLWDEVTAERRFDYTDTLSGVDANGAPTTCTVERTVRYLDAEAVHRRAWIAHRNDLRGVALWALGNDDTRTWEGIRAARAGLETWGDPTPTVATTILASTDP
jgi:spore germination protein YaaH